MMSKLLVVVLLCALTNAAVAVGCTPLVKKLTAQQCQTLCYGPGKTLLPVCDPASPKYTHQCLCPKTTQEECTSNGTTYKANETRCVGDVSYRCVNGKWEKSGVCLEKLKNCTFGGKKYETGAERCYNKIAYRCFVGQWYAVGRCGLCNHNGVYYNLREQRCTNKTLYECWRNGTWLWIGNCEPNCTVKKIQYYEGDYVCEDQIDYLCHQGIRREVDSCANSDQVVRCSRWGVRCVSTFTALSNMSIEYCGEEGRPDSATTLCYPTGLFWCDNNYLGTNESWIIKLMQFFLSLHLPSHLNPVNSIFRSPEVTNTWANDTAFTCPSF